MKKITQERQVIDALEELGGWATLRKLNEVLDFSKWATKTPEASVRRIVQNSDSIFKIRPGLWALKDHATEVLSKFNLEAGNHKSEETFTHSYYQGLLIEIGNICGSSTFVPAQDKHKLFLGTELCEISDTTVIPSFTYDFLLRKAQTVDVIWFNERRMPSHFYEVEHTTNILNSLNKFYEFQDFHADFYIVADESRKEDFHDKLGRSIYNNIKARVKFLPYIQVIRRHANLKQEQEFIW